MIEVKPDIAFIEKLQAASGSQLTTCMQCGACTASCSLSKDQNVFPRRQMIMAAWGMRDRLMSDPYVWTCHQCGDCTVSCPRGVRPGDVMTALRQEQIIHYARPRFIARWVQRPVFLPLVVLFPMLIIHLILLMAGTLHAPEGPVDYSKFFPHAWLNISFTALFVLSVTGAVLGLRKFWNHAREGRIGPGLPDLVSENRGATLTNTSEVIHSESTQGGSTPGNTFSGTSTSRHFFGVLGRILRHNDFAECSEQKGRFLTHFLVFWGFILLLFVTFFAILSSIFFDYPLGFTSPIKIAGNLGALMLFTGSTLMIINRLVKRNRMRSTYGDWFFLVSFWLLTVSGIFVETARFMNWDRAYHIYLFHLVLVWIIILYFPYTRFAHFIYRTLSLFLTRKTSP